MILLTILILILLTLIALVILGSSVLGSTCSYYIWRYNSMYSVYSIAY